jgi:predicted transposase/invertase (TIGR01784 family)
MAINAKYKDSLFSFLFGNPDTLRELYGAIKGVSLDPAAFIAINTLSDVLYMERYNDISFTINNKLVILIEHQSTINPNMPLRILLYISRVYEKIIERKYLYREQLVTIPYPECFVLYNGVKPYPDRVILKLSDAFEKIKDLQGRFVRPILDLTVTVYNINMGRNEKILKKCGKLQGYSIFIGMVREYRKTMPLEQAMKKAVEHCIAHNILKRELEEHASEVINMLLSEWNIEDAKEVWREEAWNQAWNQAWGKSKEEIVMKALAKGYSIEDIIDLTGLDTDTIIKLSQRN